MKVKITPDKNKKYFYGYPSNVCVIGVRSHTKQNFMPCAWNIGLSYHPLIHGVMVGHDRFTYKLLNRSDCFTINFLDIKQVPKIRNWGRSSGREIDKIKKFNIRWSNAEKIDAPILDDAYLTFECIKQKKVPIGDHTLFAGKVVLINIEESAIGGEAGTLNLNHINPTLYLGVDNYITPNKDSRFSLKHLPFHYKHPTKTQRRIK